MPARPIAAIRRLAPSGLRWRLAAWVALVSLICIGITFVAVYGGTGTQMRHQIDQELAGDASELAHNVAPAGSSTGSQIFEAATRYIQDQPFSASSTLLFAVVPGEPTSTNRPELFSTGHPDRGESPVQQAGEGRAAARLLGASNGYSTLSLPDVGQVRLLTRTVAVPGGGTVRIGAAEPLAAVGHAQRSVAKAFILGGVLALVGAIFAAYLVGVRVSRPLRRMAAVATRVDGGDLHPRIHDVGSEGDEVKVLADAFNHMLDRLTEAFAGQRAFVADASHELRTPLTVIRGQLEVLAAQGHPTEQEVTRVERLVQAEIARITRLVDDLLLLAKTEQTQFLRTEWIDLPAFVRELWDGMSLLARRRFELGHVPAGTLRADPDRLAQALRNLVRNAIDHTSPEDGLVRMTVQAFDGERVRFTVEDDGPGIPPEQRELVFHRFHRTGVARDRASAGTGLGLAIVRAIADAHGGTAKAGQSSEAGARIELELPGFTPAFEHEHEPAAGGGDRPAAVPASGAGVGQAPAGSR